MNDVITRTLRDKASNTTQKGYDQVLSILNTALSVFVESGYSKLSMRGIADQSGVTLGAVQHYFKTKDALVEAMLIHAFEDIQKLIDEIVSSLPEETPLEQFTAVMGYMIKYVEQSSVQQMFFELSALATRHEFAAETMDKLFNNARKTVRNLIRNVKPELPKNELGTRAALVVELLMGGTFIVGNGRPRSGDLNLDELEQRTLQTMTDIATR